MGRGLHLLQDLGRFVYVAFVVDVFAQRIVGWHAAATKVTDPVSTPLRIALSDPDRQGIPVEPGQPSPGTSSTTTGVVTSRSTISRHLARAGLVVVARG